MTSAVLIQRLTVLVECQSSFVQHARALQRFASVRQAHSAACLRQAATAPAWQRQPAMHSAPSWWYHQHRLQAPGHPLVRTFAAQASQEARQGQLRQRNRNVAIYMAAIVAGMLGLSYFSVPLYRLFCAATGYGGTVAEGRTVEEKLRKRVEQPDVATEEAAAARDVRVTFVSEVQPGLPWSFVPCQRSVTLKPGQSTLAFYTAQNHSRDDIIGVSTYNVSPAQVGYYFNKIQCFCFEEQRLRPNETVDLPVFFYLDPEFATDRRLRNINDITLSYVFFKTGELPVNDDGSELTPGESMPEHLLPSSRAALDASAGGSATAAAAAGAAAAADAAPGGTAMAEAVTAVVAPGPPRHGGAAAHDGGKSEP